MSGSFLWLQCTGEKNKRLLIQTNIMCFTASNVIQCLKKGTEAASEWHCNQFRNKENF